MKLSHCLLLLVLPAALSISILHAGGTATFQPMITGVDKDGITIVTSRHAGLSVEAADGVRQLPSNVKKLRVTEISHVTVNGLPGTLNDLKAGMAVQVSVGMDRDVAENIIANDIAAPLPTPAPGNHSGKGSSIGTRVLAVTTDTITIANPGSKASAFRVVPGTTLIKVNGAVAEFSAVRVGMPVTVNSDGQIATRIVAQDAH